MIQSMSEQKAPAQTTKRQKRSASYEPEPFLREKCCRMFREMFIACIYTDDRRKYERNKAAF